MVGSAMVFPKSFAYMLSNKGDYKILSMKSREAGLLNVEILPCNSQGKIVSEQDGIVIRDPKVDLLNQNVNFIIRINEIKNLSPNYEDIYCQFQIFEDKTVYKSKTIKGDKDNNFKFQMQFTFNATEKFLDFMINKCLYIQIWSEQKHPKPDPTAMNISTKEYFDRQKEINNNLNNVMGKEILTNVIFLNNF